MSWRDQHGLTRLASGTFFVSILDLKTVRVGSLYYSVNYKIKCDLYTRPLNELQRRRSSSRILKVEDVIAAEESSYSV